MFAVIKGRRLFSSVQLLRGGIWVCMRSLVYVFVGFWVGDYVSQLPYVWYYVGVKSSFSCLMFSLSGPCGLLFLLCFISSWTWVVVSVMLYPCILCVALLMDLFVLCVSFFTVVGCGCYC